jgi:hypothetical protein
VAILLSEGITRVRTKTRHDVDARVTDALIADGLNDGAMTLRSKLAVDVPTLYLVTSPPIDVALNDPEISLVANDHDFSNIHRLERNWEDVGWRKVMRADEEDPNNSIHGRINYRLEHMCVILGPDYRDDVAGQYRITYRTKPVRLATPADNAKYFQIPDELDLALVYYGCIAVAERDNEKDSWETKAKAQYDDHIGALKDRHGVHTNQAGLHRVVGY